MEIVAVVDAVPIPVGINIITLQSQTAGIHLAVRIDIFDTKFGDRDPMRKCLARAVLGRGR